MFDYDRSTLIDPRFVRRHQLRRDPAGNLLLCCLSDHGSGRATLNHEAYVAFDAMTCPGDKHVVFYNSVSQFKRLEPWAVFRDRPLRWKTDPKTSERFVLIDAQVFSDDAAEPPSTLAHERFEAIAPGFFHGQQPDGIAWEPGQRRPVLNGNVRSTPCPSGAALSTILDLEDPLPSDPTFSEIAGLTEANPDLSVEFRGGKAFIVEEMGHAG